MHPSLIPFLLGAEDVLSDLAAEPDPASLSTVTRLRSRFGPDQVTALVDTTVLRRRAADKFADPSRMLFTRVGLEQATSEPVARHRAGRFRSVRSVIDLGCGIGGDLRQIGTLVPLIVGVDIDLTHLLMGRHNAELEGVDADMVRADAARLRVEGIDAVFADPARRVESGRRVFRSDAYSPPLPMLIDRWVETIGTGAIKAAPGLPHDEVPPTAEAEFVSLRGDLKECTLWFGDLRTPADRRATVLPSGATMSVVGASPSLPIGPVDRWLFEPDPAVIRAGLVSDLAVELGLVGIDPTIAYLTGPEPVESVFVRAWEVVEVMAFNLKRIRAALRSRDVGSITVKKRGSPVDPADLARRLRGAGDAEMVVVVTRVDGEPTAILCLPPR